MTYVQDGYESVNIMNDGNGKFRLRVQGKPLNSQTRQSGNEMKDIWIYNGSKIAPTSQEQLVTTSRLVTPLHVVAHPQGHQKLTPMVTTSQRFIVGNSPHTVITTPTSLTKMMTTPRILTSSKRPSPKIIQTITVPPTKSVISLETLPRPRIIGSSLQQLQVTSCRFVDLDDDLNDVSLVDIDEESVDNDVEVGEFQCDECSAHFTSEQELEKHENNHLGEVNYICDQCGKEFSMKRSFEEHIEMHATEKKFECDVCHKRFDYRDNLIFHMRIHGETKSYKCYVCHKKFGNKSMRDRHVLKHSYGDLNSPSHVLLDGGKSPVILPVKDTEIPLFKCDVCPGGFSSKSSLEIHKMTHIRYDRGPKLLGKKSLPPVRTVKEINPPLPEVNKMTSPLKGWSYIPPVPEVNKTTSPSKGWRYNCPRCMKVFLKEHYYKAHVAICVDARGNGLRNTVNCAFCKKNYSVPKEAKDDGSQGMKFICEPCCTFLAQKSQFSGFTPRLENRFICNKCDKCFANEEQLRKHLDSHLPEKIFKCYECDQCFGNKKALEAHRESHYLEEERPIFNLVSGHGKDSKNRNNIQTHRKGKRSQKSASEEWRSPRKSSKRKRAKTLNNKSGNKGKRSKLSKEKQKRNNEKELPGTSEKMRQKKGMGSSREIGESHTPQKRGRLILDAVGEKNYLNGGMSDVDSDVDVEETACDEDPFADDEEEGLPNFEVFIKKEQDDFDEPEFVMENCTVFNAATSREKTRAAFTIPDKVIKKEERDDDDDDHKIRKISIKQENLSDDEMTVKEEHDLDVLGISVKEEKLDEDDLMQDEFEFTPFGEPVKKEDLLHL